MSISTNDAYLLDTNAVVARTKNDAALLKLLDTAEIIVPSIVLGELYFGAYKSAYVKQNLQQVEALIQESKVLNCDSETARFYGQLYYQLRSKGRPIPENDVWIAAIALQHNLTLLTKDEHFKSVDNLPLATW